MNWLFRSRSPAKVRCRKLGFTLFEVLLALAAIALVLSAGYQIASWSLTAKVAAERRYEMTAMGRAILDEYVVTYPAMEPSGLYADTWQWGVTEQLVEPLVPTEMDRHFKFREVTVTVSDLRTDLPPVILTTVVARRAR